MIDDDPNPDPDSHWLLIILVTLAIVAITSHSAFSQVYDSHFPAVDRHPPASRVQQRVHQPARPRPQPRKHKRHNYAAAPLPIMSDAVAFCLSEYRALGHPHATSDGALDSAKRNWGASVRHLYGERYMDLTFAADQQYRCTRAETNETAMGRVAEAVSGGDAYRVRCELAAKPCRPPLEDVRK